MLRDFFSLIYPETCYACKRLLNHHESHLCLHCLQELPETSFHHDPQNPVERLFWGRIPLEAATAYLFFTRQGTAQHLLHALKYHGKTGVGTWLGKRLGQQLATCPRFQDVDVLVPVPLHRAKQRKRGFNQCHFIVDGMARAWNKTVDRRSLARIRFSDSQTRKSRFARWQNVRTIFELQHPEQLRNRHVLLVDDVVTTGATLEACAQVLQEQGNCRVSIACVAYTRA